MTHSSENPEIVAGLNTKTLEQARRAVCDFRDVYLNDNFLLGLLTVDEAYLLMGLEYVNRNLDVYKSVDEIVEQNCRSGDSKEEAKKIVKRIFAGYQTVVDLPEYLRNNQGFTRSLDELFQKRREWIKNFSLEFRS